MGVDDGTDELFTTVVSPWTVAVKLWRKMTKRAALSTALSALYACSFNAAPMGRHANKQACVIVVRRMLLQPLGVDGLDARDHHGVDDVVHSTPARE
eukprot:3677592-Pyramimonas_sp.AAC.1